MLAVLIRDLAQTPRMTWKQAWKRISSTCQVAESVAHRQFDQARRKHKYQQQQEKTVADLQAMPWDELRKRQRTTSHRVASSHKEGTNFWKFGHVYLACIEQEINRRAQLLQSTPIVATPPAGDQLELFA